MGARDAPSSDVPPAVVMRRTGAAVAGADDDDADDDAAAADDDDVAGLLLYEGVGMAPGVMRGCSGGGAAAPSPAAPRIGAPPVLRGGSIPRRRGLVAAPA